MSPRPATIAVRAAIATDAAHGAVVPPLYLSTNFTFAGLGAKRKYDYTRSGNPTRDQLGEAIAQLEGGHGAVVTASGMAALTLVAHLVPASGRVIAPHDCYGGTFRLLTALERQGRLKVSFVDQGDDKALAEALREPVALVLVETPSNPLLRVVDIEKIARACKQHGALCAVDNTFLSPALQQPLAAGADLVVHSTTKYLNGHSDVVGGAVVAATEELTEQLTWWSNCLGLSGAPFDAFLTLRGLRTLDARLRIHQENSAAVVRLLGDHPAVKQVYYPGLPDHPGHAIAKRQQRGFGAMVSFELQGGTAAVATFCESVQHFSLAESLGGVESLVAHPASMTHAAMTPEARRRAGIADTLLRLSIGIEHVDDLTADLKGALEACHGKR
jgi:cystathionine gamma-synthase